MPSPRTWSRGRRPRLSAKEEKKSIRPSECYNSPSGPAPVSAIGDLTCENAKVSMDRVNAANPIRFPSSSDALYGDSALAAGQIGADDTVVCLVTGSGFKDAAAVERMVARQPCPLVDLSDLAGSID